MLLSVDFFSCRLKLLSRYRLRSGGAIREWCVGFTPYVTHIGSLKRRCCNFCGLLICHQLAYMKYTFPFHGFSLAARVIAISRDPIATTTGMSPICYAHTAPNWNPTYEPAGLQTIVNRPKSCPMDCVPLHTTTLYYYASTFHECCTYAGLHMCK